MEVTKNNEVSNFENVQVLTHGDILLYTLDYLDLKDLVNASFVCKFWNKVSKDDRIWSGSRGKIRSEKILAIEARKKKQEAIKAKAQDVNRDIIRFMGINTPIHDFAYLILLLLSIILSSLRADNIISSRYGFLFIPGIISFAGLNAALAFSKYDRIRLLPDITGTFSSRGMLATRGKRWHHISLAIFFFLIFISAVCLALQSEIESIPKWIVFIPIVAEFVFVGFISLTNCSGILLFTKETETLSEDMVIAANVTFFSSISVSLYIIFVLLKVAGVIHWNWYLVHIPMWIQYILGFFIPLGIFGQRFSKHAWEPVYKRIRGVIRLVGLFWGMVAGPWAVFHILLCLKLESSRNIKVWGMLIPLELQLVGLLILVAYLIKEDLLKRPYGRFWYWGIKSIYSRNQRKQLEGDEGKLVYCWNSCLKGKGTFTATSNLSEHFQGE